MQPDVSAVASAEWQEVFRRATGAALTAATPPHTSRESSLNVIWPRTRIQGHPGSHRASPARTAVSSSLGTEIENERSAWPASGISTREPECLHFAQRDNGTEFRLTPWKREERSDSACCPAGGPDQPNANLGARV